MLTRIVTQSVCVRLGAGYSAGLLWSTVMALGRVTRLNYSALVAAETGVWFVGATAGAAADNGMAARMGLKAGQLVQEVGYDDDVDHDLRDQVESVTGEEMLDEDAHDVCDVVLLWWREEDGDLVDGLVDVIGSVAEKGVVWLLTPKSGRPGYIEPSDIEEAASTAGLHGTSSTSVGKDWAGTRLTMTGGRRG